MRHLGLIGFLAATLLGCFGKSTTSAFTNPGVLTEPDTFAAPPGKGIGEDCGTATDCRSGLICGTKGTCEPGASQVNGQNCIVTAECQEGSYCNGLTFACVNALAQSEGKECATTGDCKSGELCLPVKPRCAKAGTAKADAPCSRDADCERGLYCSYAAGFAGVCTTAGQLDLTKKCTKTGDCLAGLVCGPGDTCQTLATALVAGAWAGEKCEDVSKGTEAKAYFEVPDTDGKLAHDFYRLPFPNDIRLKSGHITTGHPTPGRRILDFDPLQRLYDALNSGLDGWSPVPTVMFRFSKSVDFGTVDTDGDDLNFAVYDIDAKSPSYKAQRNFNWSAGDGGGKYHCENWVRAKIYPQIALDPGRTYAVVMKKGVRARGKDDKTHDGPVFEPDKDFVAMVSPSAPTEPRLAAAYPAYAPLRQFMTDMKIAPGDLLTAAVFTVGNPTALMGKARAAVRALAAPKLKDVTVCSPGAKSPCDDGTDPSRACGSNTTVTEIHGKLSLPIFQKGTPPYLTPEQGGNITTDAQGMPTYVRNEDVCFAIAVPKDTPMPTNGWPLTFYAHGTGGNFRSFVADGAGANIIGQAKAAGTPVAVMGIDLVQHGPRRGDSKLEPETLFYNFANVPAAKGNALQGAIDFYSLVFWAESFNSTLGGTEPWKFDATKLAVLGHSQGGTTGPLFLAHEPKIGAIVLSGAGGSLVQSLLKKTNPVNIPAALKIVLAELESVGDDHPVIHLIQTWFDAADTMHYAPMITKEPPKETPGRHLLMLYGQGDTYTPPATSRILADRLGLEVVAPALDTGKGQAYDGITVIPAPVALNKIVSENPVTIAMTHYAPTDYDGHFVLYRNDAAKAHVGAFLTGFFKDGKPEIK